MSKDGDSGRHERRKAGSPVTEQVKGPAGTPPPSTADERDDTSAGKRASQLKNTPLDGRDSLKYEDVADK